MQPDTTIPTPAKVYVALITQAETNAPTLNVLGNNTLGKITTTYEDVGVYFLKKTGAFPENKTWIQITNGGFDMQFSIIAYWVDENTIEIDTSDNSGTPTPTNGLLLNNPIEIRVFN